MRGVIDTSRSQSARRQGGATLDEDDADLVQMSPVTVHPVSVTVIVPVRDDPRLEACLRAISAQDYPAELVDVLVVDNGSRSGVEELIARYRDVRVVVEPLGGSYTARNTAVRVSTGTVLAFTDADCLPAPHWISSAVAGLARGAGIVAGRIDVRVRDLDRPSPIEAYELVHAFPQETYVRRGGACVTANLVTTRAVFDEVGPFVDDLRSGADIEWSQRANRAGHRTVYVPEAVVIHPARTTFAQISGKFRRVMEGRIDRDRLAGVTLPSWPPARAWVPPFGALGRARRHPSLRTWRSRLALMVGEMYCRYAAVWIALRIAVNGRRRSGARIQRRAV
jgi:cellulose synthase/poly-beta-1,6-N-acetylglucosamine synthase-like glycosyltransferase